MSELRHCVKEQRYDIVMAQSYDNVPWHRVTALCHGTELRHCVKAQRYDIVLRRSVTTLCHGTELHCFRRLTITTTHKGRQVVGQNSNVINECDIIPNSLAEHRLSILLR